MKKLVILGTSFLMSSALFARTHSNTGPRYTTLGSEATLTITSSLSSDTVLYNFDSTAEGWQTGGANVDTVFADSTASALPPYDGNYLYLETNASNTPFDYRAAKVSIIKYLDLSHYSLVGVARTRGGLPSPDIFNLKVFIQGPTSADTISAVTTMNPNVWAPFSLNVSQWPKADSVTKIRIGIAYGGPQSGSLPANWDGKAAFDQIGLQKIAPPGAPTLLSPLNNAASEPTSLTLE